MDARLADFVGLLRQNGLRVSPAEVADAARATLLIGVGERDPFRSALRATLVKRGPDAPVFDLQIHPTRRLLRCTTHGRGLYEYPLA